MSAEVFDWLPANAIEDDGVRGLIELAVSNWTTRWFGERALCAVSIRFVRVDQAQDGDPWIRDRACVAVQRSRAMSRRLLELALDIGLEGLVLSSVDRRVTSQLAETIASDLAGEIEQSLGCGAAARSEPVVVTAPLGGLGGLLVAVSEGRDPLLSVAIPQAVAAVARKAAMGRPGKPSGKLDGVKKALGPIAISLDATLGSANLSLADLRQLAPGDVVVLDTPLEGDGEIALSHGQNRIASGRLSEVDGVLALTVVAPTPVRRA